jgi:hypothetical protein
MAYMHNETFDIVICGNTEKAIKMIQSDYLEIDDLIAPPVQILNRKGYITEFCCSGHPFDVLYDKTDFEDDIAFQIFSKVKFNRYILFKEGISLPENPPAGFICEKFGMKLKIERKFSNNDVYKYMRNVIEAMEELYKWALDLPACN